MPTTNDPDFGADNQIEDEALIFDPQFILTEIDEPGPQSLDATLSVDDSAPFSEPQPGQEGTEGDAEKDLHKFQEQLKADFSILLNGKPLTRTFHWLGHKYLIRAPLTSGELMEVGLLVKPFSESLGASKAYQVAVLAASIVQYDDKPMPIPAATSRAKVTDIDPVLVDRFNTIRMWFPPTVDALYEQYLLLESRVMEVIEEMGKVRG